jgi:hypothetical protein
MLREDLELLTDLKRVCNSAGPFALEYLDGALSVAAEEAYARRLIDMGERLLTHAHGRKSLVLEAEPTHVSHEVCELPPGSGGS